MAGTIRKLATHTLTYSGELSSFFADYEGFSSCSSEDDHESLDAIEFDLRDGSEAFGDENELRDAPVNESEAVIPLQSAPISRDCSRRSENTRSEISVKSEKPVRDISKLVDELVGSSVVPSLVASVAKKKNPSHRSTIFGSTPVKPPPRSTIPSVKSPIFPVLRRDRSAGCKSNSPKKDVKWKCPDAWIPNHACDEFCFDSLRGL